MNALLLKSAIITLAAAMAVGTIVWAARPDYRGIRAGRADEEYLDSSKCLACHPGHYDSWARTFHSRMTQQAASKTVLGDFERDNTYEFLGVRARMERRGEQYTMSFSFPDGRSQTHRIVRTVGSRRIQQYITEQDGQHTRLPIAYDLVNRRWMSLNGSFFHADSENFFQHQTTWDANCVFCHNVKAQPGRDPATGRFATEVTELGIACGACHGQGAKHVEAASSPLRRTLWRTASAGETHIVQPEKIDTDRSMMICGHCHGQRVPVAVERIQQILSHGDPYNAGEDLSQHYRPVTRETKIGDYSFANRFWNNGSPRLTAYEYQGILRSACLTKGQPGARINCLSCHSMHEGDPRGQIKPENLTNKPCLACHQQFAAEAALTAHTKHSASGEGSRCYNCHMPRVVYGVMAVHRTHEISVPDPRLTASDAVPNACNQCHLDKSVNWAIAESRRLWPARYAAAAPSTDAMFDQPEGMRALFAGDALTRALMAEALGAQSQPPVPYLLEAFRDEYPIVRYFAARGLAAAGKTPKLDYLANAGARQAALAGFQGYMQEDVLKIAEMLRKRRVNIDLEVGE